MVIKGILATSSVIWSMIWLMANMSHDLYVAFNSSVDAPPFIGGPSGGLSGGA